MVFLHRFEEYIVEYLTNLSVPRGNSLNKSLSSRLFSDKKALEPVSFNVQSQEEFDDLVLNSDIPVIVDFHAE